MSRRIPSLFLLLFSALHFNCHPTSNQSVRTVRECERSRGETMLAPPEPSALLGLLPFAIFGLVAAQRDGEQDRSTTRRPLSRMRLHNHTQTIHITRQHAQHARCPDQQTWRGNSAEQLHLCYAAHHTSLHPTLPIPHLAEMRAPPTVSWTAPASHSSGATESSMRRTWNQQPLPPA